MYDDNGRKSLRGGKPIPRGKAKTPCQTSIGCPKESPDKAHEHELSDRNRKALDFYFSCRGMGWQNLSERMKHDAVLIRNNGLIDRIVRGAERNSASQALAAPLMTALSVVSMQGGKR